MNKSNVLIIGPERIPSYTIGIYQPLNYLKEQGLCHYWVKSEREVTLEDIEVADVIVFFRTVRPKVYQYLKIANKMGIRTVYSIDDNFLALPSTIRIGQVNANPKYKITFIKLLKRAKIVKVASEYFGDYIREQFNPKNVVYFPGSVDFEWIDKLEKPVQKENEPIVIGYAGSDKEGAFEPLIPALQRILDKYGNKVRIEFMGYIPQGLEGWPHVEFIEYKSNYSEFLENLYQCSWDIGLAPLENTLFDKCKTNNRFREYAACRIPGIYTASSPAYNHWVVHKKTGYLVPQTEEGWFAGIEEMINNPAMRQKIQQRAESVARKHFTIKACAEQWRKQILRVRKQ